MSNNAADPIVIQGDTAILSDRYAGALLELAEKEGLVDAVALDVDKIKVLWEESADFRSIASDPRLDSKSNEKIVDSIVSAAELNELTRKFLLVAARNHRLNIIPVFIQKFTEALNIKRGEFSARVCVASSLSDEQYKKLADKLSSVLGGKVKLVVKEDASILGGLTVQIGSQLFDASVKTHLEHMERSLAE
ncbi:MAG: ATP synthase F1 subunit delta [Alphaproteobacteria bacterium]|nr:ATP synthase F1 subunit delta [Alphaproteobacteria bacterium]MCL2505147.1 ATP synthase F1 subunit delta [Alphaproteobacteria bacterium]